MTKTSDVQHQTSERGGEFTIQRDAERVADMTYRTTAPSTIVIDHTFVDPSLRGTGAGMKLMNTLVRWARDNNIRVQATCSYALAMFEKHEGLRDVYSP